MARLPTLDVDTFPELEPAFSGAQAAMGFIPNSMLTMAHRPQLAATFSLLATAAFGGDIRPLLETFAAAPPPPTGDDARLPPTLVQLIAFATSLSTGCRYCQAHTAHNVVRYGASAEQVAHVLDYETSPHFTEAERTALALAFAAARVPNEAEDMHFTALSTHFSEAQIAQIVAVIALFGFLNRWNDTLATTLESAPRQFGEEVLARHFEWSAGKHG
jgi:AhpD family alkylhydroperoxidase